MNILEMQEEIMALGWRFTETTFNDGSGEAYIEFSQDTEATNWIGLGARPTYSDTGERLPEDAIGWGCFPRHVAWEKAYQYIVKGVRRNAI